MKSRGAVPLSLFSDTFIPHVRLLELEALDSPRYSFAASIRTVCARVLEECEQYLTPATSRQLIQREISLITNLLEKIQYVKASQAISMTNRLFRDVNRQLPLPPLPLPVPDPAVVAMYGQSHAPPRRTPYTRPGKPRCAWCNCLGHLDFECRRKLNGHPKGDYSARARRDAQDSRTKGQLLGGIPLPAPK